MSIDTFLFCVLFWYRCRWAKTRSIVVVRPSSLVSFSLSLTLGRKKCIKYDRATHKKKTKFTNLIFLLYLYFLQYYNAILGWVGWVRGEVYMYIFVYGKLRLKPYITTHKHSMTTTNKNALFFVQKFDYYNYNYNYTINLIVLIM